MNLPENIEKLMRSEIKAIDAYVPIEPTAVLSQRIDIAPENIIKLDGNENPYGCSAKVRQALANYSHYHIYPDPEQRELRKALEEYIGFKSEQILAGSGSDELIDLILRLFIEPGDKVINCPPTFGMYKFCTEVCGGKIVNIPRKHDFSVDITAIKKAIDKKTKVIFIASPNNPSANLTNESDILELLTASIIVVVDEAYAEFSGSSITHLVPRYSNLVVLRTFSKWAGLAGLRVGYGIFPPSVAELVLKIKQPYNLNVAAQAAMLASLEDVELLLERVQLLIAEREELSKALASTPFIRPLPSQANFILCRIDGIDAGALQAELRKRGIMVRRPDSPVLRDCLRISVGLPEHRQALIEALNEIGGNRGASR